MQFKKSTEGYTVIRDGKAIGTVRKGKYLWEATRHTVKDGVAREEPCGAGTTRESACERM